MSRPSPAAAALTWSLALAVGIALAAPAGCSARADAEAAAPVAPPAPASRPTATPVVAPAPAPADTTDEEPVARAPLPDGFVRLSEAAPEIAQEIRYTTAFNFVGAPIEGYLAPECILTEAAADALRRVAADLARDGLGLKVYDCYRPQRAVDHFVRWARTDDEAMKRPFYPEEAKGLLFRRGYIARRSGHSRGSTVDLTLVALPAADAVVPESAYPVATDAWLPRCDRPVTGPTGPDIAGGGRFPERDLDMGTAYDCLSPLSATASAAVGAVARRNRERLREAMSRRGFRNYSKEWWHYTLRGEPHPRTFFDFPVE